MTARAQVGLVLLAARVMPLVLGVAVLLLALFAVHLELVPSFLFGFAVLFAAERLLSRLVIRRGFGRILARRYGAVNAAVGDARAARAALDELVDTYSALSIPPDLYLQVTTGMVLLIEERFVEARKLLEPVDVAELPNERSRAAIENNLAWALAHEGEPGRAVTLAERALARLGDADVTSSLYGSLQGSLGAALTLDGRHAAAIAPLERAVVLGAGDTPSRRAIRHYYLGLAQFGLGRDEPARTAWEQARRDAPDSRWGRLAAQKLGTTQSAYR